MRSIRLYIDIHTMINIYYTFFYPHLIYGVEFYGHAANCYLNPIYLLLKICSTCHLSKPSMQSCFFILFKIQNNAYRFDFQISIFGIISQKSVK